MILYSFKRCPFAIRARMSLIACEIFYEHREVDLKNKPRSLIEYSPKATVPVLILDDGSVIDESYDIIKWAIRNNDPCKLSREQADETIIEDTMQNFLPRIYHCKYPERYDTDKNQALELNRKWLAQFNEDNSNRYVFDDNLSYIDIAIFPFVKQWHYIDKEFTESQAWVFSWLNRIYQSEIFEKTMNNYPKWQD